MQQGLPTFRRARAVTKQRAPIQLAPISKTGTALLGCAAPWAVACLSSAAARLTARPLPMLGKLKCTRDLLESFLELVVLEVLPGYTCMPTTAVLLPVIILHLEQTWRLKSPVTCFKHLSAALQSQANRIPSEWHILYQAYICEQGARSMPPSSQKQRQRQTQEPQAGLAALLLVAGAVAGFVWWRRREAGKGGSAAKGSAFKFPKAQPSARTPVEKRANNKKDKKRRAEENERRKEKRERKCVLRRLLPAQSNAHKQVRQRALEAL